MIKNKEFHETTPESSASQPQISETIEKFADNPIPLPPRDRKPLLTSKPRHTRKHPLIIPPSSLRLDKITIPTPTTPTDQTLTEPTYINNNTNISNRECDSESVHFEQQIDSELAALDDIPQEQDYVDGPVTENPIKLQRNYVSCEDLLEFADTKPSSQARGNDSDEVRIMSKVLGNEVSLM